MLDLTPLRTNISSLLLEENLKYSNSVLKLNVLIPNDSDDFKKGFLFQDLAWEPISVRIVPSDDGTQVQMTAYPLGSSVILPYVESTSQITRHLSNYKSSGIDQKYTTPLINCNVANFLKQQRLFSFNDNFETPEKFTFSYLFPGEIKTFSFKSLSLSTISQLSVPEDFPGNLQYALVKDTPLSCITFEPRDYPYTYESFWHFCWGDKVEIKSSFALAPLGSVMSLPFDFEDIQYKSWVCIYHSYDKSQEPMGHKTVFAELKAQNKNEFDKSTPNIFVKGI